jgi:thiamine kinase
MLPDDLERVAEHHVPGAGKPDIQRLKFGLENDTYRVLRDGSAYALRVPASNPCDPGLDRGRLDHAWLDSAWEARVLERAVAAGLAPAVAYCDPLRGILISRWALGRTWNPADARRRANISRLAELVRRIHALPMPAPARLMSPRKWIDYYGAALTRSRQNRQGDVAAETSARPPDTRGGRDLSAAAVQHLAALAALPNLDPVVCHSDLHTLNLIDRGDSLVLLDWEYAHASDPLWDLAGWSANNDFGDELALDLLTSYAGRPPTNDEYLRLRLLIWLYDYVCLLWSELYLSLDRGVPPGVAVQGDATVDGVAARVLALADRLNASK